MFVDGATFAVFYQSHGEGGATDEYFTGAQ
jgi:hypothetical protein